MPGRTEPSRGRPARAAQPIDERIAEAARRLFAARGIRGTGMRDIAVAAEITLTTLYRHVGSKDDLIRHLLVTMTDVPPEDVSTLPSGLVERVAEAGRRQLARLRANPHDARFIAREALAGDPTAVATLDAAADRWRDDWRAILVTAADVAPGADLDAAAEVVRAALWGIFVVDLGHEGTYAADEKVVALGLLVAAAVGGSAT